MTEDQFKEDEFEEEPSAEEQLAFERYKALINEFEVIIQTSTEQQTKNWLIKNLDRFPTSLRDLLIQDTFEGSERESLLAKYPCETSQYDLNMRRSIMESSATYSKKRSGWKMPADLAEKLSKFLFKFIGLESKTDRILIVGSTTVIYRFAGTKILHPTPEQISHVVDTLTKILTVNPSADLKRYEDALHISIIDVQSKTYERNTAKGFYG